MDIAAVKGPLAINGEVCAELSVGRQAPVKWTRL